MQNTDALVTALEQGGISEAASVISGGIGHVIPTTLARLTYSETAVLPTPVASRTCRTLSPSSCVSRRTSRIFLIDILILAISCPCRV